MYSGYGQYRLFKTTVIVLFLFCLMSSLQEVKAQEQGFFTMEDGNRCYIDNDGSMHKGWLYVNGDYYLFDSNGIMITGWKERGGALYYFNSDGTRTEGITRIGNLLYFFSDGGYLIDKTGWYQSSQNGNYYLITSDGSLAVGWQERGGATYYLDPLSGARATGPVVIDGQLYLFSSGGQFIRETGWVRQNGKYYLLKNGVVVTGWINRGGATYYLNPSTGERATGITKIGNQMYFFSEGGQLSEQSGWVQKQGKYYLLKGNGVVMVGWVDRGGATYYLDPEASGARVFGKNLIDGKLYAFEVGGQLVKKSGWFTQNGKTYLFKSDYSLSAGWTERGGANYYFDPETGEMTVGSRVIDGEEYFFSVGGILTDIKYPKAKAVLDQVGYNLQAAYDWSVDLTYYGHTADMPQNAAPGSMWYADYGFDNHKGNCYVMAATFYEMAKMLGYSVRQIEGGVLGWGGRYNDHSWTEIDLQEGTYIFDPNYTNETGRNGWKLEYGQKGTWVYKVYSVMSDEPR